MVNFKQPYLVRNISHFWRHWHISLSTWLRDYLYIPLGGNRARGSRTLANLIIVMGLGGLWHGAGWWFVLWGLYIGMLLVLHRLLVTGLKRCGPLMMRIVESRSWHLLCVFTTFILVCVGWLLFRVASVPDVARQWLLVQSYLSHMFSGWFSGDAIPYVRALLLLGGGAFVFQWFHETFEHASEWNPVVRNSIWILCIMLVLILGKADGTDFIYFQF
jgi:D-alanyl-lipoteichoic acid acyltransferase DltB (MBOAT superfamily)